MEGQIIITLGRRIGAGGLEIAHRLSGRLGIKVYDKDLIWIAARESGLSAEFFEKNDEKPVSKGLLTNFLGQKNSNFIDTRSYVLDSAISEDGLFKTQSDIIRKLADTGSGIFVGRCADYVLRDREGMLSVFITADRQDRIARIMEKDGMSAKEAEKYIDQGERRRASYYNYYTFKEWGDSASYDLCLNSSRFGIDGCVDCIIRQLGK
ncbi:MAG: cytidylate kinase-like family protein [Bacteroidales bacterium]|nr:cytidylate kinase-like family protein [Bacteroidales bacterium]MBO7488199.1 cytidylate kinase-like family protein [Bacteroidales bacterium]